MDGGRREILSRGRQILDQPLPRAPAHFAPDCRVQEGRDGERVLRRGAVNVCLGTVGARRPAEVRDLRPVDGAPLQQQIHGGERPGAKADPVERCEHRLLARHSGELGPGEGPPQPEIGAGEQRFGGEVADVVELSGVGGAPLQRDAAAEQKARRPLVDRAQQGQAVALVQGHQAAVDETGERLFRAGPRGGRQLAQRRVVLRLGPLRERLQRTANAAEVVSEQPVVFRVQRIGPDGGAVGRLRVRIAQPLSQLRDKAERESAVRGAGRRDGPVLQLADALAQRRRGSADQTAGVPGIGVQHLLLRLPETGHLHSLLCWLRGQRPVRQEQRRAESEQPAASHRRPLVQCADEPSQNGLALAAARTSHAVAAACTLW